MSESKWSRESISWLVLEGAAIVASILLAFSIDAWWEDRQERQETRQLLAEVLEDFRSAKSAVDFPLKMAIARMEAADKILESSAADTSHVTAEEFDRLLADLSFFIDIDVVPEGSVNALIAAGKIGQLKSKRLRHLLSNWPATLEIARYNLRPDYDIHFGIWWPYLLEHGNATQVIRTVTHIPGHPERTDWVPTLPSAGVRTNHLALLDDNKFTNIVAYYRVQQFSNSKYLEWLDRQLDESIRLIEQELVTLEN